MSEYCEIKLWFSFTYLFDCSSFSLGTSSNLLYLVSLIHFTLEFKLSIISTFNLHSTHQLLLAIPLMSVCCVSLCLRRSTLRWNALWQSSQANGLNPVCFREWVIRFELWLNALPHTWHLCGFSPGGDRNERKN